MMKATTCSTWTITAVALLNLVSAADYTTVEMTTICNPLDCIQWNCRKWCDCWNPSAEEKSLYAFAGCIDDGLNTCANTLCDQHPPAEHDTIEGDYKKTGYWLHAVVVEKNGEQFRVKYGDGEEETLPRNRVRVVKNNQRDASSPSNLDGQDVQSVANEFYALLGDMRIFQSTVNGADVDGAVVNSADVDGASVHIGKDDILKPLTDSLKSELLEKGINEPVDKREVLLNEKSKKIIQEQARTNPDVENMNWEVPAAQAEVMKTSTSVSESGGRLKPSNQRTLIIEELSALYMDTTRMQKYYVNMKNEMLSSSTFTSDVLIKSVLYVAKELRKMLANTQAIEIRMIDVEQQFENPDEAENVGSDMLAVLKVQLVSLINRSEQVLRELLEHDKNPSKVNLMIAKADVAGAAGEAAAVKGDMSNFIKEIIKREARHNADIRKQKEVTGSR